MPLKNLSPYLLTAIILFGILYFLPSLGIFLRPIERRVITFLKNVYHAQELGTRNTKIQEENAKLTVGLIRLGELEKENQFLRERLAIGKEIENEKLLLASIIGKGPAFQNYLIINKGLDDGLKGGEAVTINPRILVGKVDKLFANRALITLLSHPSFRVWARTASETTGVAHGESGGEIVFDEVSQASPLVEGDIIITDNKTPAIPKNLLIGKAKKIISLQTDIFKKAQLEAMFDPDTLEQVFVILP